MFGLIHRGELPQVTENEFEHLCARLKALWLVEHNEDGSHLPTSVSMTGEGTLNRIPVFTDTNEIGDSIMNQIGATIVLTGGLTASGTVIASAFSGNGSGLTNLPAGQLTGTITPATQDLITRTGTLVSGATGAGFTVALATSTMSGDLPDVNLSANVPLLNFSSTLDWTNCNTIVVAPGVDAISNAVNAMQNGDTIILTAGNYTQTVEVSIPVAVTRFAIIGPGADICTITYTNDTNGIVSNLTNDAYRIVIARIRGFSMVYANGSAGTYSGILLWGYPYESTTHGSMIISDICIRYGAGGTCFAVGIQLVDVRSSYITNVNIRTSPSNRVQEGIVLQSCMNVRISGCWIMSCNNGLRTAKASDSLILNVIKHGCEDIHVVNTTFYIFNYGAVLGYKTFAVKMHQVEFSRPGVGHGIFEDVSLGTGNGGYHQITSCYFDNDDNHNTAYTFVYIARPGTLLNNCHFIDATTLGGSGINGVIFDSTAHTCQISGSIFRYFGRGGAAGILSQGDNVKIASNIYEATNAAGNDIYIGASANNNLVIGNMYDVAITDIGTATTSVDNKLV